MCLFFFSNENKKENKRRKKVENKVQIYLKAETRRTTNEKDGKAKKTKIKINSVQKVLLKHICDIVIDEPYLTDEKQTARTNLKCLNKILH